MGRYMHRPGEWNWEWNIHGLDSDDETYQAMSFDYEGLGYHFWVNKKGEIEPWEQSDGSKIYCKLIYACETPKDKCLFTQEQIEALQDKAWHRFSRAYFRSVRGYVFEREGQPSIVIGYNKYKETDKKDTLMWFGKVMLDFELSKLSVGRHMIDGAKKGIEKDEKEYANRRKVKIAKGASLTPIK